MINNKALNINVPFWKTFLKVQLGSLFKKITYGRILLNITKLYSLQTFVECQTLFLVLERQRNSVQVFAAKVSVVL